MTTDSTDSTDSKHFISWRTDVAILGAPSAEITLRQFRFLCSLRVPGHATAEAWRAAAAAVARCAHEDASACAVA